MAQTDQGVDQHVWSTGEGAHSSHAKLRSRSIERDTGRLNRSRMRRIPERWSDHVNRPQLGIPLGSVGELDARSSHSRQSTRCGTDRGGVVRLPLPPVLMDITRKQLTSGMQPAFYAPMNAFNHMPKYPPLDFKAVVRPNFDILYSSAWLDLTGKDPSSYRHRTPVAGTTCSRRWTCGRMSSHPPDGAPPAPGPATSCTCHPDGMGTSPRASSRSGARPCTCGSSGRTQTNGSDD